MRNGRLQARLVIWLGLLVPGLLLAQPSGSPAESRSSKAPQKKTTPKERRSEAKTATASATPSQAERCVHVVRKGDSVSRIAQRHRVGRQSVIAANRLANPDALRPGQRLAIPGCDAGGPRPVVAAPSEVDASLPTTRVGPRRVPTRLYLAMPEFGSEAVPFMWPVEGPVLSDFGKRRGSWHAGVDIRAESGTPILAAAAGTVVFSGWAASYGRTIKIGHDGGFVTIYAHNLENMVAVGDVVQSGSVIGSVGRSGRATASHLHFEIRQHGMAYNPLHLLARRDWAPLLARDTVSDGTVSLAADLPVSFGADEYRE